MDDVSHDLDRAAARMLCVGFHGETPSREVRELIRRGVGGVILFGRNVRDPRQVASLCAELKRAASDRPLIVSIDQEGGRVAQLRDGFTSISSMREIGESNDVELAHDIGRTIGRELRAVNIDLDFAPVLDVDTNPDNPVIADRSFGRSPQIVSRMGVALVEGLQSQSVAACGKHFPGHGDTSLDSHLALPKLAHDLSRLNEIELPPFRAAIESNVAAIMTAHVIFEAIDPKHPATMSRPVIDGILRKQLGFNGVIVSDDLEMKAIADHFGVENAIVHGAAAGVDLFLVCHSADVQHRAIDALVQAVQEGRLPRERIDEAGRRIDALMNRFIQPPQADDPLAFIGHVSHEKRRDVMADPTEYTSNR